MLRLGQPIEDALQGEAHQHLIEVDALRLGVAEAEAVAAERPTTWWRSAWWTEKPRQAQCEAARAVSEAHRSTLGMEEDETAAAEPLGPRRRVSNRP